MKGYASSALPIPVSVQGLVIRDYCKRNGLEYEMAEIENKHAYSVLEGVLASKPVGIVAYSLEQFDAGSIALVDCPLHFALEGFEHSALENVTELLIKLKALLG